MDLTKMIQVREGTRMVQHQLSNKSIYPLGITLEVTYMRIERSGRSAGHQDIVHEMLNYA